MGESIWLSIRAGLTTNAPIYRTGLHRDSQSLISTSGMRTFIFLLVVLISVKHSRSTLSLGDLGDLLKGAGFDYVAPESGQSTALTSTTTRPDSTTVALAPSPVLDTAPAQNTTTTTTTADPDLVGTGNSRCDLGEEMFLVSIFLGRQQFALFILFKY